MALTVTLRATAPIQMNVALSAKAGEVLALVGPSGAGKSTILRGIAGLWTPDTGRVAVGNAVWFDSATSLDTPAFRRRVGMVFQSYALFPQMSALTNVMAAGANRARAQELLTLVRLAGLEARRPAELSGGQQQRVAVARALARDPEVLLLDEPFSAVDHATRQGLYAEIERLRTHLAMPVVLVTHDLEEARRLADQIAVIDNGQVLRQGPTQDILFDPVALRGIGLRGAGATLTARLEAQEADGLTRLQAASGPLWLPRISGAVGDVVRVQIMAHDVILSRNAPVDVSALNIIPGVIDTIVPGDGPGAIVTLQVGSELLLARITQRSVQTMGLAPGQSCFALVKSMAVAPHQIGRDSAS
ncbi:ATP-binding cassette domain-containing protein [Marinovum sp. 2_MG-2023]|uniref:molybdenum ABC transporter ATP-binding protein n=1 Tax=unclassified Marinovum TaxID=2647166 RepID=UPI0026E239F4|nr:MULTISPECIES: ATP-binding cassette domain-containing protein [unclassified Marinovum]MDO6730066.1 ATP-binding cassette domain-containing protein [Marinovum sp. 2_MG-2023]MDO6779880.1 ATP-binding cassette domain-containing protein [Marinovum sp. 1_MG-2023]